MQTSLASFQKKKKNPVCFCRQVRPGDVKLYFLSILQCLQFKESWWRVSVSKLREGSLTAITNLFEM